MENTTVNKGTPVSKPMPPAFSDSQKGGGQSAGSKGRDTQQSQPQSQAQGPSQGQPAQGAGKKQEDGRETEQKSPVKKGGQGGQMEAQSVGDVLTANLSDDTKETIERVITQANKYFSTGKEYINANPKEAVGLAVSLGVAAWALLCTKPGRQAFQTGATVAAPHLKKWMSENFSGAAKA